MTALALLSAVALPALAAVRAAGRAGESASARLVSALCAFPALYGADARLAAGFDVPEESFSVVPVPRETRVSGGGDDEPAFVEVRCRPLAPLRLFRLDGFPENGAAVPEGGR